MNNDKTYIAEQYNIIDAIDCIKEKAVAAIGENYKIKHSLRMIKSEVGKMLYMAQNNHIDDKTYNEGFISGYEAALMYIDGIVNTMIDQHDSGSTDSEESDDNNSDPILTNVKIPDNFYYAIRPIEEYYDLNTLTSKAFTPEDELLNAFYNKRISRYPNVNGQKGYSLQLMETIAVTSLVYPKAIPESIAYLFNVSSGTVRKAIALLPDTNLNESEKSA